MTPATEARLLALATALGMTRARAYTRRTPYGDTVDAVVYDEADRGWFSATGVDSESAAGALARLLATRIRDRVAEHRAMAAHHAAAADRLEAALTAALATGEHAPTPGPVCPAPTGAP